VCALAAALGCDRAPPEVDLAKAPWLDPKVQAEGLASGDSKLRSISAHNLGNIGAAASKALPTLEKVAQNDPDQHVREMARKAIEKIHAAVGDQ